MAGPIAQEDLIGTLVPDVYIQGITLETSGSPIVEDEPHTISDRELKSLEAFNSAEANDSMRVTVDLSLKEKFDNDALGSWFQQEQFWKYMKVKVIQTTDKHIIDILSNSQSAIDLTNTGLSANDFGPEGYGSDDTDELEELADKLGFTGEFRALPALLYFMENTSIQVFSLMNIGTNLMEQHSETVDSDGNTVHDFTLRAYFGSFDGGSLKSSTSNLAYFAVSYMDFAQLQQEYNLAYDFSGTGTTIGEQNGKVASERVITDNKVVSTSYIFKDAEGQIWSGPIHQMEDGRWMTKSSHGTASAYLTRESVPNTKVQDFRDIKEIKRLQIDLSSVENEIFVPEGQTKMLSNDKLAVPRKHFYFSDVWLARDADGDARFMFAWDFSNFVKTNSRYGRLFDNDSSEIRNAILAKSKIHSLEIYRKRVRDVMTQNQLGSPWRGEVEFDKNSAPSLIAISGESNGTFITKDNADGSLRQSFPAMFQSQTGIKYFTGMDKSMRNITDGEYQYGVVAYVQDGTIEYLKDRLEKLSVCRHKLNQYLVEGSKPGMTRFVAEFANPHIDMTHAESVVTSNSPGSYDPLTNRFTKSFAFEMQEKYPNIIDAPYVECVVEYIEALQLVTNALTSGGQGTHGMWVDRLNGQEMIEKLQNFVSPTSGNPQGVMVLISLYDLLISQYARLVDEEVRPPGVSISKSSQAGETSASIATSSPDALMKLDHWFFNHSFDSNVKKRTGINYLAKPGSAAHSAILNEVGELGSVQATGGLKIIDGGTWSKRVDYETTQYFPSTTADCNISYGNTTVTSDDSLAAQSMSFLTPASVHTPSENYVCTIDQGYEYDTVMASDMLMENKYSVPLLPNTNGCNNLSDASNQYTNSMEELFSMYNVTTIPVFEPGIQPLVHQLVKTGGLLEECSAKQGEAIDPHPAWVATPDGHVEAISVPTSCDPEMDSDCDPSEDKNADYSELLRLLANDILSSGPVPGNVVVPNPTYQNNSLETAQIYDVTQDKNIVSWMNSDTGMLQTVLNTNSNTVGSQGSVSDAVSGLPNQVKALLLASTSPSSVKWQWHTNQLDIVADVTVSSTFKINYGFLAMVQYFDGFEIIAGDPQSAYATKQNLPSIKKPVWKKLTPKVYKQLVGKEILCKLNPYKLEAIGIRTYDGLKLPVYDSYFLLTPLQEQTTVQRFPSVTSYWASTAANKIAQATFYTEFASTNIIKE